MGAFKNVRGTTPYFEAKKKDLFAMIRQIGPPNIFFTKSVHETSMLPLIKSLQEKDNNKIISNEEVNSMTKQQKKKLIQKYPIDVVNFLDALFRHHINSMKKSNSFGKFHIEDYFYRVEFQQRGSAHIHCLFWLQTDEGRLPPKVFLEESPDEELEEYRKSEFVEYFESIVSASASHEGVDNDAIEYQKHRHTFSCYKNKKGTIVIQKSEGFGKHTGSGDSMELQICRHNFPRYPVPETTILKEYNEIERNDVTLMKTCKKNLDTIQKFILRQTTDNLEEFEKLKFDDFLNELGINKDDYIMALRGTVNQKMMFLPKRNCNELFINNYNPKILKDDPSNQDIQIIAGEEAAFAVATYAAKYISKDEAGQSKLLKRIEEESRLFGDSTDLQLKKLGKVLEDTREVSMQEVIFRLFGYNMCSSSRKKKFIQTLPPEKRDGLLKANIEELDDKDDIFCYNIIDYYQNRPDSLEDISLASFAANYEYYKHNTNTIQIQDDNIQEDDNNEDEDNITEQTLLLKNNMGYLKERKKSSIIRYFKGKYDDDITRIRCVMLLFHPFRDEVLEVHNNEKILEKYNECKERVEEEQSLFEPNPEFIDFLENIEQENIEEDEEQQQQLDNDFVEEDTTRPEEVQDWLKKQGKVYDGTKIRLEDKKKLNKRINTSNVQQRKILDELMDIDDEEQYFLYLYRQAGTGKTYLLNTIILALEFKSLKSGVDLDKPLILVMSPTASAAKHLVYGDTIHGALKINGFDNFEKQMLHGANATLAHDLSQVKHVLR